MGDQRLGSHYFLPQMDANITSPVFTMFLRILSFPTAEPTRSVLQKVSQAAGKAELTGEEIWATLLYS